MENDLNISDVMEVLQTTDPQYVQDPVSVVAGPSTMYAPMPQQQPETPRPFVDIVVQPAPKALRFRYECEGRSAGSIPGVNSTAENKTFPTIRVVGHQGRAVVVVSCVTKDAPYRPHPHNLVGKDGCKKGVCTLEMSQENMTCSFSNLGIQCVKKKDIEDALKVREEIRVDPFRTGFNHRSQPTSIDLNAVRLCFQVFLEGPDAGKFKVPLQPVVSEPIFDKKAMSDLVICRMSDVSCFASGSKDIILLCEKVAKEDITVRFYEEKHGELEWEGFGDFQPTDVHKQVAIAFRTPAYRDLQIQKEVEVKVQLRRPSDGATSEPRDFKYLPLDSVKRKKVVSDFPPSKRPMTDPTASTGPPSERRQRTLPPQQQQAGFPMQQAPPSQASFTLMPQTTIKREPSESNFQHMLSPAYQPALSPSPQNMYLPQSSFPPGVLPQPGLTTLHPQPSTSSQDRYSPAATPMYIPATPPSSSPHVYIPPNSFNPAMMAPQAQNTFSPNVAYSMASASNIRPGIQTNIHPGSNILLDMDTQQNIDMNNIAINSTELDNFSFSCYDASNLSENLSGQLRLVDSEPGGSGQPTNRGDQSRTEIENMSTDSISKITLDTFNEMCKGSTGQ